MARLRHRRRMLGAALAWTALGGATWHRAVAERRLPADARALRPPGAVREADFTAACVRCGLCVQGCPVGTLRLAGAGGPVAEGTPYFRARDVPCAMCAHIPCVAACPTGALQPTLRRITDARIGLAGIPQPAQCYSMIGAAKCDSCWRACPLQGTAIRMVAGRTALGGWFTPTVDPAVCTGCGLCEKACIANPPAIRVEAYRHAA